MRAALAITLLCTLALLALAQPKAPTMQGPALPVTPLQKKLETACLECHDAGIIVQQRLDKAAWQREVDKMMRWGAVVDKDDYQGMIDYFAQNFPSDKPAYVPPRPHSASSASRR